MDVWQLSLAQWHLNLRSTFLSQPLSHVRAQIDNNLLGPLASNLKLSARNLDVIFDSDLKVDLHVKKRELVQFCFYQLEIISKIIGLVKVICTSPRVSTIARHCILIVHVYPKIHCLLLLWLKPCLNWYLLTFPREQTNIKIHYCMNNLSKKETEKKLELNTTIDDDTWEYLCSGCHKGGLGSQIWKDMVLLDTASGLWF